MKKYIELIKEEIALGMLDNKIDAEFANIISGKLDEAINYSHCCETK